MSLRERIKYAYMALAAADSPKHGAALSEAIRKARRTLSECGETLEVIESLLNKARPDTDWMTGKIKGPGGNRMEGD